MYSLGIISGQFVGGSLSEPLGKTKIQCIVVFTLGGICKYTIHSMGHDGPNTAI
jgi:hypothetical protein